MNDYIDREKMAENEIARIEKDYNDLVMKNILIKYELKLKNEILLASWNEYIEKNNEEPMSYLMFKEAFEAGWESAMIHMVLDEVL